MFDEVKSWMIGLFLVFPFSVFVNWLQLGHVEGQAGYQRHWKLQSIHIGWGLQMIL
jgi:hypothetical protein